MSIHTIRNTTQHNTVIITIVINSTLAATAILASSISRLVQLVLSGSCCCHYRPWPAQARPPQQRPPPLPLRPPCHHLHEYCYLPRGRQRSFMILRVLLPPGKQVKKSFSRSNCDDHFPLTFSSTHLTRGP